MADNVPVTPGSGASIATDDVGGTQFQRIKLALGADGVHDGDVSSGNPMPVLAQTTAAGYAPDYDIPDATQDRPHIDPGGAMKVRGQILTDEGGYRVNFSGSALGYALGTCAFTAGSDVVTGSGFAGISLAPGDYVKRDADGESAWRQVLSLDSDIQITLAATYAGTTGTSASSYTKLKPVTGTGATITVASGQCTIAAGTTAAVISEVERDLDWLPVVKQCGVSVSQRIANQSIYIGFYDEGHPSTPYWFAWFLLDGTTNTTVKCQSARNPSGAPVAAEIEETTVTLPNGATTAASLRYRVEVLGDRVLFFVNGVLLASHFRAMPGPGDLLTSTVRVLNGTTPASGTNIVIDYDTCKNHNKVEVGVLSDAEVVTAAPPPTERSAYNVAGVITINTVLMTVDCQRTKSLNIHCISMGTTGVVTPEWSSDGVNDWRGDTFFTPAGASATTFNAAGQWITNVKARYFRLRLSTATTAGTTTINVDACAVRQQTFLATQPVSGTVSAGLNAGTNTIGGVRLVADTGQGASTSHRTVFATNITTGVPTLIKNGATQLNSLRVANNAGAGVWVHLYNLTTAPTLGTSTPEVSIWCQAGQTTHLDTGAYADRFGTGLSYSIVDNCATIPAVGGTITIAGGAAAICISARYT